MEMKLKIDGKDQKVSAQILQGTLWVHHNGRTFTLDVAQGRKSRKKGGAAGSSDQVLAPMPGKVTKVLVAKDTPIKMGQAVLVMEAMKMEYTLKADVDGIVEAINCIVGEQVALGKVLVKITEAK